MGTLNVNHKKRGACGICLLLVCLAPQCGLCDAVKDIFYEQLSLVTVIIPASEFLVPCDDWNGHVGSIGSGYKEVHGASCLTLMFLEI